MNKKNIILLCDAYKVSHWKQYPSNTQKIYSYFESRGGKFDSTVFYGLQILLKKYLEGQVVEQWMIDEADEFCKKAFGHNYFNREGWEYILQKHNGKLPVVIKAIEEGVVVPTHNVLMTIENTDPKCYWLTNFLETLLVQVWYPCTVATLSREIKKRINIYAKQTGSEVNLFHLNDFGMRGVSSLESAGIGGSAHLINFMGTDNVEGIQYAMKYYNSNVCGFSVAAAEHSTITSWGREHEFDAYNNLLEKYPEGILSVVSDSYNIYKALEYFGTKLKDKILKRNGKFVVRPDSSDPIQMSFEVVDTLWNYFGGTVNDKGFKVLNPRVGVIYGDGINIDSIEQICIKLLANNYAIENIIFGCGGALLQQVNRDTQNFAFKCSAIQKDNQWIGVNKDPITSSMKKSKEGKLQLIKDSNDIFTTIQNAQVELNRPFEPKDYLEEVFRDGKIVKEISFEKVRENAKI